MTLTAVLKDSDTGETVGMLVLDPKVFKSGSTGYFGQGKIVIDGKRYQTQCQVVAIKAKETPAEE